MHLASRYSFYYSAGEALPDNPSDIFGNDLKLWLNTESDTNKTLSGDFSTRIDSLTSDDPNGYAFTNSTGASKVRHNGKCWWLPNVASLVHASASEFNLLHNGSAWTIAFRFNPISAITTAFYPIISNHSGSTIQTGIVVQYDNRSSSSRTNALVVSVNKSSSGNTVFSFVLNNFFTQGTWTDVIITCDGTTLEAFKDGVSQGTSARVNAPVVSDASANFNVFKLSSAETYMQNSLFKHLVIVNRVITSDERTSLRTYLTATSETLGANTADVYGMYWQSLMAGYPTNPPVELRGQFQRTWIWEKTHNTTINTTQQIQKLDFGVNNNTEGLTKFGPELSFAGDMEANDASKIIVLAKYAESSTPLYLDAVNNDWNIASSATQCAALASLQLVAIFQQLKYEHDYTGVLRGIFWLQGETDALNGNATYKDDLYAVLKNFIDDLETNGYTVDKCRILISLTDQVFAPARPSQADIVAAQEAVVSDFLTDNPSYVGKVLGLGSVSKLDKTLDDGVHMDGASVVTHGEEVATFFIPFRNE